MYTNVYMVEEKNRQPCFMREDLYDKLKNIAKEEGKTIYEITNHAIGIYEDLIYSLRDKVSFGGDLKDKVNYVMAFYLLLKQLISVNALSINKSVTTPKDLSLLISDYISPLSSTEEGKINGLFAIFDIIAQLFNSKVNTFPSRSKQIGVYRFENKEDAEYFKNFSENLIKRVLSEQKFIYSVEKSDLIVRIELEAK